MKLHDITLCVVSLNVSTDSKILLLFIISFLERHRTFPKVGDIIDSLNFSEDEIKELIKELRKVGLIDKNDKGVFVSNEYLLKLSKDSRSDAVKDIVLTYKEKSADAVTEEFFNKKQLKFSKINTHTKFQKLFEDKYAKSTFTVPIFTVSNSQHFVSIFSKIRALSDRDKDSLVDIYLTYCKEQSVDCNSLNFLKHLGKLLPKLRKTVGSKDDSQKHERHGKETGSKKFRII